MSEDNDLEIGQCRECGRYAPVPNTGCATCKKLFDAMVEATRESILETGFNKPLFPHLHRKSPGDQNE